jgi:hypothetical protein
MQKADPVGRVSKLPDGTKGCTPDCMIMATNSERARAEFPMMKWIAVAGVAMVALAPFYLYLLGDLSTHAAIATVLGVFLSVLLASGLFALAFFSDKSGHDDNVSDATRGRRERP